MLRFRSILVPLALASIVAVAAPGCDLVTEDAPCPCASGQVCCPSSKTCATSLASCPGADQAPYPDASQSRADAGSSGLPDAADYTDAAPQLAAELVTDAAESPYAIALGETHIYWTDRGDTGVYRLPLDDLSRDRERLAGPDTTGTDIEVVDDQIFWTDYGDGSVWRLSVGGTPAPFAQGQNDPVSIATAGDFVYWTNWGDGDFEANGSVMRAALDGSSVEELAGGVPGPDGIVATGEFVAWANYRDISPGNSIWLRPHATGDVDTVADGQERPVDIDVTPDGRLVWTTWGYGQGEGQVVLGDRDGDPVGALATGVDYPSDVEVAGGHAYFTATGIVARVRIPDGAPVAGDVTVLAETTEPEKLVVGADHVYFTDDEDGAVYRVAR